MRSTQQIKRIYGKISYFLICVAGVLFCSFGLLVAQYSDFDRYQGVLTRQELEAKLPYLGSGAALNDYITITDTSLRVYPSSDHKQADQPEFVLRLGTQQQRQAGRLFEPDVTSPKPLQGLRVALDPGHLGGDMALIEERFVDLDLGIGDDGKPMRFQFNEGTLAVATAKLIQRQLQAYGATVMLTKEKPGQSVYHQSFDAWCAKTFDMQGADEWLTVAGQKKVIAYLRRQSYVPSQQRDLAARLWRIERAPHADKVFMLKQTVFRLGYNTLDLQARAVKINAFNPHVTLVIHYNAVGSGTEVARGNYSMTFVPGSFLVGELSSRRARYELVRLLVTDDLKESIKVAGSIAKHMEQTLTLPLMGAAYDITGNVVFVAPGIFCRNLLLTRCIHGVLCYGETLIQNNAEEAQRLAQKDITVDGIPTSSRVVAVAQAYVKGICQYFGLN
jgi:N-acetylmuramoyl-L-alanine amidase